MQSLNDQYSALVSMNMLPIEVPEYIKTNIRPDYGERPYQKEAFARFVHYSELNPNRKRPTQLLFHMATGSGKTLIMAGAMLHLYKLGYRRFIFFVQSTSIIEKTKDNFLNQSSSKYLFNNIINIDGTNIRINEVSNFSSVNEDDINIVFTTIQGLHQNMNNPKENTVTYEDFEDQKVVLLADEAHHINAETKKGKLTKDESDKVLSWESTVTRIFKANPDNYLLEFTATADLKHENIKQKYFDKVIFDYPLKKFREDKYSKEVKLLQADLAPINRALLAVILNQYRRKIFEKNGLNIKPTMMLKSKKIAESKDFFDEFTSTISSLTAKDISKVVGSNPAEIISKAMKYFSENNISLENLALEIKEDFSEDKCISVNSKDDTTEKQLIVNSLEDKDNEYRAVFAVDKLNEGWDVLNLFDIVRLYNTRDADHKTGKVGKTTMSEAQLIGRGARYCPFKIEDHQDLYKRKYDDDLKMELRVCEELYYHSAHNPKYISELNNALIQIGMKDSKVVQRNLFLKEEFKKTNFYKNGKVFVNKQIPNLREEVKSLNEDLINKNYKVSLSTGYTSVSTAFINDLNMTSTKSVRDFKIRDFGNHVIRKAMNKLPFYRFNNLQKYFPHLNSVSEFITSDDFLNKITAEVSSNDNRLKNIHEIDENTTSIEIAQAQEDKLTILMSILSDIAVAIPKDSFDYKGSKIFSPKGISKTFKDKMLNYSINTNGTQEIGLGQGETTNIELNIDLSSKDWYAFNENYGTSEEKFLVKCIEKLYEEELKEKYKSGVYLLRNERHFKLYTFDEGLAFEPDFVLFLQEKEGDEMTTYQLFIEPKGGDRLTNEDSLTKEKFLKEIESEHKIEIEFPNQEFKLIGLRLFNESITKTEFQEDIKNISN
ncbi:MAG: DEAD/DEAH box helicase family protein [Flavobacteriales bacterium]|nr:DEAD/DEAH box helicase family protein [Flavobacteriales bacterium]